MPLLSPPTSPTAATPIVGLTEPTTPTSHHNLRKRKAELLVPTESPLTKRFRKLNLREPSKVTKRVGSPARNSSITNVQIVPDPWSLTPPPFQRPSSPPPAMEVDDTPHKVYVNDLDSSVDDADSPRKLAGGNGKGPIIFLCDVEREMTKIPLAVLKASTAAAPSPAPTKLPTARSGNSMDLILYKPPEKVLDDSVMARKSVLDAKERFRSLNRGSTMEGIRSTSDSDFQGGVMGQLGRGFTDSPMSLVPSMPSNDPDAMVLDDL